MSNVKYHHLIVIVGVEDGQIVSTEMGGEEYESAFPNGTVWNPKEKQWEFCVDDEEDPEYDTQNLTNDLMVGDYIWDAIKRGTEN